MSDFFREFAQSMDRESLIDRQRNFIRNIKNEKASLLKETISEIIARAYNEEENCDFVVSRIEREVCELIDGAFDVEAK